MFQRTSHKYRALKATALAPRLVAVAAITGALTLLAPVETGQAAAPACRSGGTLSDSQRQSLQNLPLGLRSVLKAVRDNNPSSCKAPTPGVETLQNLPAGTIDPVSVLQNTEAPASLETARSVPDEVLAIVTGDASNIANIAASNGLVVRSSRRSALLNGFIVRFGIPDGRTPTAITALLQANPAIDSPAPNHIYQLQAAAAKASVYEEARFAPGKIGLPLVNPEVSGQDIIVGVIDTAVDPDHPDLQGVVLDSFDALPGQPVNNRRHGTAVAGLIAGRTLIRGVAPGAKLLVARAFDDGGKDDGAKASATSAQLLDSLDWTIEKGARIVNMSFTGPRNDLMSRALASAADKNVLLIAAAGNYGPQAPAAYPAAEPSVLAVTAIDINNKIYKAANVGQYVFVAAPGVDVLAAAPDQGVDMVSGTSFAAPFISGLAALMLEQNSALTPRQFAKRVRQTSLDLGQPGRDRIFGVGLADLGKALRRP